MSLSETLAGLISSPKAQMGVIAKEIDDVRVAMTQLQVTGGQGAAVVNLAASTDITLASPVATTLTDPLAADDVNTALGVKADQSAISSIVTVIETRLDNLESKLNALLTSLRNSGQIHA